MSLTTCPSCNGTMQVRALVNRGEQGCTWEMIDCLTCDGVGVISTEQAAAIAEGARLREERLARNEHLHEAAQRLGMKLTEYCDLESGKVAR